LCCPGGLDGWVPIPGWRHLDAFQTGGTGLNLAARMNADDMLALLKEEWQADRP